MYMYHWTGGDHTTHTHPHHTTQHHLGSPVTRKFLLLFSLLLFWSVFYPCSCFFNLFSLAEATLSSSHPSHNSNFFFFFFFFLSFRQKFVLLLFFSCLFCIICWISLCFWRVCFFFLDFCHVSIISGFFWFFFLMEAHGFVMSRLILMMDDESFGTLGTKSLLGNFLSVCWVAFA
ncbi:hypothetical protein QBC38DRAFT_36307 [Podospora fimiseda]|uniref:Uncharacterized protein n=1 Tax=Podospora fimiseda TaxID=252190 RepID=A0AAN7BIC4_9PEZI|nr:hypothetical protein QBC38DRAFT_36307 [Podospora fimiseda]